MDVTRVVRRGSTAVHFTQGPLKEGADVDIEVDWCRRFDHMQQHSGAHTHLINILAGTPSPSQPLPPSLLPLPSPKAQHLITAVADRDFGHKTKSWQVKKKFSLKFFYCQTNKFTFSVKIM